MVFNFSQYSFFVISLSYFEITKYDTYLIAKCSLLPMKIMAFLFHFELLKIWVLTPFYTLFLLTLIGLLYYVYRLNKKNNNLDNRLLKTKKDQTKQLNDIENRHILIESRLNQEIKDKRLEIVKLAKENEDKSHLITKIKEKLKEADDLPSKTKTKWHEITILVDEFTNTEDKTFELQMDEIHQSYIKNLKSQYPQLTSQDLRLCVYLKTGMNSKEIAEIMHVLPSSIYITRSRLRKKLGISPDDDLLGFLNNFEV